MMAYQLVSALDKELSVSIGTAAREARKSLKLTQEDAAERIGVSAEFYARIERGHALPSVPTFARICSALSVSADAMIGRLDAGRAHETSVRWTASPPTDPPEVRRLLRRLRKATPATLRLVSLLIKELEQRD